MQILIKTSIYNYYALTIIICSKMEPILATCILFIFVAIPCHSQVYIVDGVNGKDTNTGQNIDDAFKTINRCAKELTNPGDECQIFGEFGYYDCDINCFTFVFLKINYSL